MNKQTIDEMVIGKAQLARVGMRKLSNLSSETRNNALETMSVVESSRLNENNSNSIRRTCLA